MGRKTVFAPNLLERANLYKLKDKLCKGDKCHNCIPIYTGV